MVLWGFPRRFGRFGWEPSQLSSGGVRVKVVVRGSFRGSSFPFSFSLSGLPAGRPAGRVGRGGHPESPLERAGWGGSPGFARRAGLRGGGGRARSGASRGRASGAVRGFRGGRFAARGAGAFPRRTASFARFGQKSKITNAVVFASFGIRAKRASPPYAHMKKPFRAARPGPVCPAGRSPHGPAPCAPPEGRRPALSRFAVEKP